MIAEQPTTKIPIGRSLTLRYAIMVSGCIFLFGLIVGVLVGRITYRDQLNALEGRMLDDARFIADLAPESVYFRDFLALENMVRATTNDREVVYAVIVDPQGRALTRYVDRENETIGQLLAEAERTPDALTLFRQASAQPGIVQLQEPIVSEGLLLGNVLLGYSTESVLTQLVFTEFAIFAAVLVLSVLLSLATTLLWRWRIQAPLDQVIETSRALASGELSRRVPVARRDEMGMLGRAFNQMAADLERTLAEMQQARQEIEETSLALAESEARSRAILDTAADGIITIDEHGAIESFNPAAARIFGYRPEEIIGQKLNQLMPVEESVQHDAYLADYLRTGTAKIIGIGREMEGQRKDGTRFPLSLAVSEVKLDDQRLFTGIVRDITQQKEIESALRQAAAQNQILAQAVEAASDGVVITDATQANNAIIYVNSAFEQITGYTFAEVEEKNCRFLQGPETDQADLDLLRQALHRQEPVNVTLLNYRKNGRTFWNELRIAPIFDTNGTLTHYVGLQTDITQRREYDKLRDDFVSTVSHELRTPLAAVMGWTETLLTESPGPLNDMQKRFLGIVYESSERLNRLVEEILTVSRVQQGSLSLHMEPFNPSEALDSVLTRYENMAEAKQVTLDVEMRCEPLDHYQGDVQRIEQVLTNLMSNAIKFSPSESTVTVQTWCDDGAWHVSVADQGIGIPEAEIEKLFTRFYRASNATDAQIQGTGLGLFVCRAIVEGHGGEIEIKSTLGEGTMVHFSIPLKAKATQSGQSQL